MAGQANLLANIEAQLQQAMQRKKPREQTVKFDFNGQVRACCLSKPFTYSDLLKSIENLYGSRVLASIDHIRCLFSRGDALRLPVTNDDDLNKVIAIGKANGLTKLNFLLIKKTNLKTPTTTSDKRDRNDSSSLSDDEIESNLVENGPDSPPPGTITTVQRRTTAAVQAKTANNDGGVFIPESSGETYSNRCSPVPSRQSSDCEQQPRRSLPSSLTSNANGGSTNNSSSDSSQISSSSSESFRTQCSTASSNQRSPLTPTNWKLGRQLGQGAFGKVFLCYDVDNGSELAIKQISIRGLNQETTREVKILECEINVYKQLDHERIVRYHGAFRADDYLQIFMEYMTGGSVREQILNYGALTEQLTRKYTRQILEGLIYLHENRYIHRDIKCANILRDISGNIKLGDFGTSRQLIAITNQNQPDSGTIGTAHWTAPEIIQGQVFGRKADIWSLGCTIVEMLTTGPPWQHLQPIAAIFHIVTCDKPEYQLPVNASKLAREFIGACLTKDYNQRPTALDLLSHPFLCDFQSTISQNQDQTLPTNS